MNPNAGWLRLSPPRIFVAGFAVIILIGSLLLMLPISNTTGKPLVFIDALFTAASATCVTGLVVKDTGTFFTTFGQVVIAALIQVGGLGFMTMATLIALVFKRRISLRERLILQEAMNQTSVEGIVGLIRKVLLYSLVIEGVCATIFAVRWSFDMPVGRAIYFGIWHAISMFNNAGFDLFGHFRSLTGYVYDPVVNFTAMFLIISGGIGFVVMSDLAEYRKRQRLTLHTKVVLSMTAALIVVGTLVIFVFEFTNPQTLGSLDWGGKLLGSLFQSVTPRTAGANTLDIASLRQATQFFIIILMFIGASPGSTGGGIKTTTFALLVGAVFSMLRGREDIVLFKYRLAQARIYKALTITLLGLLFVIGVTMILSATEDHHFLMILFETVSAFGTVGLSMGLTPDLTVVGKLVITLTMFAGRLGPLTLAYALGPKKGKELYRHPEGKMIIG
ncbi:TrkH family potassium uptake protein [Paenibacillus sp. Aloe-11]|uniref:TrkH family potassium uptake protein n=1 Tax=Paenibacillus sp. Aloe-11 TaxID=1050222 RepID=UPI00024EF7A0|nr:Trk family potassium uptake protein [Paenibacillus sp. Aloe-11]EHS56298.1 V-type sodium ATP synthase subunit J (Na(+)-translocating ATPase subunit J) [Paenibacillus sp. Aloe-11]